jgi:VIT1/CCC1 family predicted Fe2+/Mn2+ transporter
MDLDRELSDRIESFQRSEITEYHIYSKLAGVLNSRENALVLRRIADDELRHYQFWKQHTKKEIKPRRWDVFRYFWISRILGITFGIKLMERGEEQAQDNYARIVESIPEAAQIIEDEDRHESELIAMIEEERLGYMGSIVLGLNDALVELTGALAGFTFALQNTRLIALAGLITGIAASFSMAASEYLSTKSEGKAEKALKSSVYTGLAYVITVFLLIIPYLTITNPFICLGVTLATAVLIILLFNFYISVAKDYSFKERFFEMAGLSLGVAALTFGIGYLIRQTLGVET